MKVSMLRLPSGCCELDISMKASQAVTCGGGLVMMGGMRIQKRTNATSSTQRREQCIFGGQLRAAEDFITATTTVGISTV